MRYRLLSHVSIALTAPASIRAETPVPVFMATGAPPPSPRTDLHKEPIGNMVCQLAGRKRWLLVAPEESSHLMPRLSVDGCARARARAPLRCPASAILAASSPYARRLLAALAACSLERTASQPPLPARRSSCAPVAVPSPRSVCLQAGLLPVGAPARVRGRADRARAAAMERGHGARGRAVGAHVDLAPRRLPAGRDGTLRLDLPLSAGAVPEVGPAELAAHPAQHPQGARRLEDAVRGKGVGWNPAPQGCRVCCRLDVWRQPQLILWAKAGPIGDTEKISRTMARCSPFSRKNERDRDFRYMCFKVSFEDSQSAPSPMGFVRFAKKCRHSAQGHESLRGLPARSRLPRAAALRAAACSPSLSSP